MTTVYHYEFPRGLEFGYWAAEARAHYIRMLIAYLGLEVNEVTYKTPQEWAQKKQELVNSDHCPFPNLPYLIEGQKMTTETVAIAIAIVNKANRIEMLGKTPGDQVNHLSMMGVCADLFSGISSVLAKSKADDQQVWPGLDERLKYRMAGFVKILANRPFLLYYITVADLFLAYLGDVSEFISLITGVSALFLVHIIRAVFCDYGDFPQLQNLHKSVWALPGLSQFKMSAASQTLNLLPAW